MLPLESLRLLALQAGAIGLAYAILTYGIDASAPFDGLLLSLGAAFTVFLHEAAHYRLAHRLGAAPFWAPHRLSIFSYPRRLSHQRLISLAGPAAGASCALVFTGVVWFAHRPLLFVVVAWCLVAGQIGMLLPVFSDGSLLFMRKETFNVH